ncbi:hypothetical protein BRD03_08355 [Halobacteriales archaeon QS_9_68_17]|nr:MAG: hypothetical protein BRD03_08355 [Halobacteriales archaeon QS_9_68_17]
MTPVDRGVLALVLVSAVLGLCVHYDSATDRWSSATPSLYVSSDPRVLVVALPVAGTSSRLTGASSDETPQ